MQHFKAKIIGSVVTESLWLRKLDGFQDIGQINNYPVNPEYQAGDIVHVCEDKEGGYPKVCCKLPDFLQTSIKADLGL